MNADAGLPPLIGAMGNPAFYPHATRDIRLLETHISWVILTGDFAYKIKKPVNFGFLDFTSLARRRHFCDQELLLNRRLASEIYLEVLPISSDGDAFMFGDTNICEYALMMRQFAQTDLLDRRLESGRFDPAWMDMLAIDIATLHSSEQSSGANPDFGDPLILRRHIEANLEVGARHIDVAIGRNSLAALRDYAERSLTSMQEPLSRRQSEGHIRCCHGDLHLRNITLLHDRPVAFDCIEFNDEYRMIDAMNDAAFLIMDCDARGHPELGLRFLSRYLEQTGDYAGLALLPLYLCYRAGVRGKVACLLGEEMPATEAEEQWREARHYFELATRYTQPAHPQLFAIGGLSGSGKSHLALEALQHERAVIIRSDATRKRIAAGLKQDELYSDAMHRHTYQAMLEAADTALQGGWSVILDATFLHPGSREDVRRLARQRQAELHFYWLDIPEDVLRRRVNAREKLGRDVSDANLAVLEQQLASCEKPQEDDIHFLDDSSRWPDKTPQPDA
jgi:hypothetical protein